LSHLDGSLVIFEAQKKLICGHSPNAGEFFYDIDHVFHLQLKNSDGQRQFMGVRRRS
jgi:hypothetical protein